MFSTDKIKEYERLLEEKDNIITELQREKHTLNTRVGYYEQLIDGMDGMDGI